jgi:hypothetical protein
MKLTRSQEWDVHSLWQKRCVFRVCSTFCTIPVDRGIISEQSHSTSRRAAHSKSRYGCMNSSRPIKVDQGVRRVESV